MRNVMADEERVALPAPDDKRAMLTSAGLLLEASKTTNVHHANSC
jgi:hypothetical protein